MDFDFDAQGPVASVGLLAVLLARRPSLLGNCQRPKRGIVYQGTLNANRDLVGHGGAPLATRGLGLVICLQARSIRGERAKSGCEVPGWRQPKLCRSKQWTLDLAALMRGSKRSPPKGHRTRPGCRGHRPTSLLRLCCVLSRTFSDTCLRNVSYLVSSVRQSPLLLIV